MQMAWKPPRSPPTASQAPPLRDNRGPPPPAQSGLQDARGAARPPPLLSTPTALAAPTAAPPAPASAVIGAGAAQGHGQGPSHPQQPQQQWHIRKAPAPYPYSPDLYAHFGLPMSPAGPSSAELPYVSAPPPPLSSSPEPTHTFFVQTQEQQDLHQQQRQRKQPSLRQHAQQQHAHQQQEPPSTVSDTTGDEAALHTGAGKTTAAPPLVSLLPPWVLPTVANLTFAARPTQSAPPPPPPPPPSAPVSSCPAALSLGTHAPPLDTGLVASKPVPFLSSEARTGAVTDPCPLPPAAQTQHAQVAQGQRSHHLPTPPHRRHQAASSALPSFPPDQYPKHHYDHHHHYSVVSYPGGVAAVASPGAAGAGAGPLAATVPPPAFIRTAAEARVGGVGGGSFSYAGALISGTLGTSSRASTPLFEWVPYGDVEGNDDVVHAAGADVGGPSRSLLDALGRGSVPQRPASAQRSQPRRYPRPANAAAAATSAAETRPGIAPPTATSISTSISATPATHVAAAAAAAGEAVRHGSPSPVSNLSVRAAAAAAAAVVARHRLATIASSDVDAPQPSPFFFQQERERRDEDRALRRASVPVAAASPRRAASAVAAVLSPAEAGRPQHAPSGGEGLSTGTAAGGVGDHGNHGAPVCAASPPPVARSTPVEVPAATPGPRLRDTTVLTSALSPSLLLAGSPTAANVMRRQLSAEVAVNRFYIPLEAAMRKAVPVSRDGFSSRPCSVYTSVRPNGMLSVVMLEEYPTPAGATPAAERTQMREGRAGTGPRIVEDPAPTSATPAHVPVSRRHTAVQTCACAPAAVGKAAHAAEVRAVTIEQSFHEPEQRLEVTVAVTETAATATAAAGTEAEADCYCYPTRRTRVAADTLMVAVQGRSRSSAPRASTMRADTYDANDAPPSEEDGRETAKAGESNGGAAAAGVTLAGGVLHVADAPSVCNMDPAAPTAATAATSHDTPPAPPPSSAPASLLPAWCELVASRMLKPVVRPQPPQPEGALLGRRASPSGTPNTATTGSDSEARNWSVETRDGQPIGWVRKEVKEQGRLAMQRREAAAAAAAAAARARAAPTTDADAGRGGGGDGDGGAVRTAGATEAAQGASLPQHNSSSSSGAIAVQRERKEDGEAAVLVSSTDNAAAVNAEDDYAGTSPPPLFSLQSATAATTKDVSAWRFIPQALPAPLTAVALSQPFPIITASHTTPDARTADAAAAPTRHAEPGGDVGHTHASPLQAAAAREAVGSYEFDASGSSDVRVGAVPERLSAVVLRVWGGSATSVPAAASSATGMGVSGAGGGGVATAEGQPDPVTTLISPLQRRTPSAVAHQAETEEAAPVDTTTSSQCGGSAVMPETCASTEVRAAAVTTLAQAGAAPVAQTQAHRDCGDDSAADPSTTAQSRRGEGGSGGVASAVRPLPVTALRSAVKGAATPVSPPGLRRVSFPQSSAMVMDSGDGCSADAMALDQRNEPPVPCNTATATTTIAVGSAPSPTRPGHATGQQRRGSGRRDGRTRQPGSTTSTPMNDTSTAAVTTAGPQLAAAVTSTITPRPPARQLRSPLDGAFIIGGRTNPASPISDEAAALPSSGAAASPAAGSALTATGTRPDARVSDAVSRLASPATTPARVYGGSGGDVESSNRAAVRSPNASAMAGVVVLSSDGDVHFAGDLVNTSRRSPSVYGDSERGGGAGAQAIQAENPTDYVTWAAISAGIGAGTGGGGVPQRRPTPSAPTSLLHNTLQPALQLPHDVAAADGKASAAAAGPVSTPPRSRNTSQSGRAHHGPA